MNFPADDWLIIKILLQNISNGERENKKILLEGNSVQANNLIDPDKIDGFIAEIDLQLGRS